MQKVAGERYVYKFVCDPEALFNMAYGSAGSAGLPSEVQNGVRSQSISSKISSTNDVSDLAKHPTSGYGDAVLAMYSNTAAGRQLIYIYIVINIEFTLLSRTVCKKIAI